MDQLEGALLREVSRVQHDKTIQAVRDVVDRLPTTKPGTRNSWDRDPLTAAEFRTRLLAELQRLREQV